MTYRSGVQEYKLDPFDTYTYLVIGGIALLASLAMFLLHVVKKEMRKHPGDLISMIAFAEFWLALHWFISAIRTDYITSDYDEDSFFCKFNSFIAVNAASLEITYNLCLITYVLFSVRTAVRKTYIPTKTFHIFCWSVTTLQFFFNQKNMYKRNPYGTCSLVMEANDLYLGAGVLFVAAAYAIVVYVYTSSKLPDKGSEMRQFRSNFINYYRNFLQVLIAGWIIIFFSYTTQIFKDKPGKLYETLFAMGRLGNTVKVLTPIMLFFIRLEDPKIKSYFYQYYSFWSGETRLSSSIVTRKGRSRSISLTDDMPIVSGLSDNLDDISVLDGDENRKSNKSASEDSRSPSTELTGSLIEDEPQDWLNQLPAKMKESSTRTFVAAISVMYYQTLKKKFESKENKVDPNTKEVIRYELEGQSLMTHCRTDKAINDCTFVIYFPEVFCSVLTADLKPKDIKDSFNIHYNEENIKKAGESGGGASGELFMFSKDNRLILKTITAEEHKVFTSMIGQYVEHMVKCPDSMIGRIFGLFSFYFNKREKPIRLVIMENLFCINKEAVLRKYDLKGSKHSRQVLQGSKYESVEKTTKIDKILKDIDFELIENEIHLYDGPIPGKKRANLDETLSNLAVEALLERVEADINFFREQQIIDYSMIVAVVDTSLCDVSLLEHNLEHKSHHWMQSADRRFIYILGIIDYFQKYTLSKKAERFFKKVRQCDTDLQTSSQPPFRYGIRFLEFIHQHFR
jgi:1-phosphatidylinositol-4-phosphate 5-kinase